MLSRAWKALATLIGAAALLHGTARACTAVDLVAVDGTVIAGRTMEWAFDMQWKVVSIPKGSPLVLDAPPAAKLPARTVATRYAILGFAPGILPVTALLEGQNEAGLGMSANFLPGFTEYQQVTAKDRSTVSILNFATWALGSHASVAELRAALPGIKVWTDPSLPTGPTPPWLHWVFVDRRGDGIVVEYVKGELRIHDNLAHVLTNAPTYDWHLTHLRNYLNVTTMGTASVELGPVRMTELGQGGGTIGLPGDSTPPARFVRAAFQRQYVTRPADAAEAIQAVGHILNTVDIPLGISRSREGKEVVSDYTQWVVIKDLTHGTMRVADYAHRLTFVTLDVNAILAQATPSSIAVGDLPYPRPADAVRTLSR